MQTKAERLEALLADCFEVRLKPDRLAYVYELLREKYPNVLTQHRFSQEIDLAWATVWRILNEEDAEIHESSLRKIEDFAIPQLARAYARDMDARQVARLILTAPELEGDLTERLQE